MVFYFVTKKLVPGSLLQRFVDGDDEFRNSRLKLIPSVPKVTIFPLLYNRIGVIFSFVFSTLFLYHIVGLINIVVL